MISEVLSYLLWSPSHRNRHLWGRLLGQSHTEEAAEERSATPGERVISPLFSSAPHDSSYSNWILSLASGSHYDQNPYMRMWQTSWPRWLCIKVSPIVGEWQICIKWLTALVFFWCDHSPFIYVKLPSLLFSSERLWLSIDHHERVSIEADPLFLGLFDPAYSNYF